VYPPAPWAQPRVIRRGGDVVCGRYVPEGTIVGIWPWAASHSATNFAEPDAFIPSRWLDDNADPRFKGDRKDAAKPFSFGPRDCVGRK